MSNWKRELVNDIQEKMIPVLTEKNFPDVTDTLFIDVRFEYILDGIKGVCMEVDTNGYEIILAPNQTKEEIIVNMCHELVHVMQAASGMEFDFSVPYNDQIHEIEAYAMQDDLARKYKELINE